MTKKKPQPRKRKAKGDPPPRKRRSARGIAKGMFEMRSDFNEPLELVESPQDTAPKGNHG